MSWIRVKDRLPEFDKPVLVYCRIYGRYISTYTHIGDTDWGQWHDYEGRPGALPPIHWQPLPDPPQDKDNG